MLRSREGAWVGWPGVPDAELDPFVDDGLQLHPVALSEQEVEDYYEGFSNGTLWPLYHDVVAPPAFHRHWWQAYLKVNQRFAEAAAEVAAKGATVWVQDYQLQLLPAMLRELRPDLRIGFFLHIPFPPTELFMQLPWRRRIVEGAARAPTSSASTPRAARATSGCWPLGSPTPNPGPAATRSPTGTGWSKLGAFPISIDSKSLDELAAAAGGAGAGQAAAHDLGDPDKDHPRRRPARLHQGHQRPAARVRGAARRGARSTTARS